MINVPGLADHVGGEGARPFEWGRRDCCLFVADWVRLATGLDPAASWRGRYGSLREALRLTKGRGGFVEAISAEMDRLGFARTADPLPGDVGLVRAPVGIRDGRLVQQVVGAIRTGRLWSVKARRGVGGADFPLVVAWSLPLGGRPE